MGALQDSELISRKLADLRWILVASPAHLEKRGRPETTEDLRTHSCVRYLTAGRPWPFEFADGESIVPNGQFATDDSGSIRQATINSAGIAYQLRMTVTDYLKDGRLVEVLPHLAMPALPAHALHAFDRQLPIRGRLFIDFLVEKLTGLDL
jgi:DNA-binding transcriptional LysR family regulator